MHENPRETEFMVKFISRHQFKHKKPEGVKEVSLLIHLQKRCFEISVTFLKKRKEVPSGKSFQIQVVKQLEK